MLALPTFLIFVSLSVAAIPLLGSRPNGQAPHFRRFLPAGLPALPLPDLPLAGLPPPANQILGVLPQRKILRRFIMGADYASSSGPFLGKSPHKRQDPLFGTLGSTTQGASDLKDELSPNLSPMSAPT